MTVIKSFDFIVEISDYVLAPDSTACIVMENNFLMCEKTAFTSWDPNNMTEILQNVFSPLKILYSYSSSTMVCS